MKHGNYIFTSESVTEGHPDKIADQISDAILDAALSKDPNSRVAIETFVTTGMVMVGGEMTTEHYVDIAKLVRDTIKEIGYDDSRMGFDYNTCAVLTSIDQQSEDIALGVDKLGAGDQGLMFGFACNETPELMPLPIVMAHKLTKQLAKVRKDGDLVFLRPDGKSQVSINYKGWKPESVNTVVVSSQHSDDITTTELREKIKKHVIKPILDEMGIMHSDYISHINPTGKFVIGGPQGDAGLTGRKIIVDTYGGYSRHGGGAFSGKDATKVDRSAAYMARYIAKNIVAAGYAEKLEVQLAYAIGVQEPVSIMAETFNTGKIHGEEIVKLIRKHFDLTPAGIISKLELRKPVFKETAAYGHFGRDQFSWEKLDMVNKLHS